MGSTTIIRNYWDCQFYTVKKAKLEPSAMNSMPNKQKRSEYVSKAMQLVDNSKTLIYIDESNYCNLFSRRNFRRSKKGESLQREATHIQRKECAYNCRY